jgi:hypothetical protein
MYPILGTSLQSHRLKHYLISHLSIRSALYPIYMSDPAGIKQYYADPILANPNGHQLIADILISYMQYQICTAWTVATGQSHDTAPLLDPAVAEAHGLYGGVGQKKGVAPPDKPKNDPEAGIKKNLPLGNAIHAKLPVPLGRINRPPTAGKFLQEISPYCVSANDLINPLPPSLFYGSGWSVFHPPAGSSMVEATSYYWYSSMPTSKLRIPLQVGAGDVGVYYLREPISQVGEGSAIECWVDNNYDGAKTIENAADIKEPVAQYVFRSLTCEHFH